MVTLPRDARLLAAPRVALVSGFWGQNIGNAFFNVGGHWVLRQVFGEGAVAFVQDQPGYRTFHNQKSGNPAHDAGFLRWLDVDYLVLQGPLLTASMAALWRETLATLTARGTRIILLGAAFFRYTKAEFSAVRELLEAFPPAAIVTRDSRSWEIIRSWQGKAPLYDGLDSAFFAPKAFTPPRLSADPYVALTFDRYPEPDIAVSEARNEQAQKAFRYGRHWWNLRTPGLQNALSHSGKAVAYLGHLLDRRTLPATIDGLSVVRPEHRSNPHMTRKIYQHRNALVSDEPWTYLTLYANAELVLADRVHACVAALAYGRPAMLFNPSPRQALFARLGVEDIGLYPVEVDPGRLEEEQERQLAWLRGRFA